MEAVKVDSNIEKDVLHLGHGTPLTPEEIAKALAHHKKHNHEQNAPQAQAGAGKKGKKGK